MHFRIKWESFRKRVIILGGTGRVGSSTASALLRSDPRLDIALASRSRRTYEAAVKKRPELANTRFVSVDIEDAASLEAALRGADLVVHTAGPFQRKMTCDVLEAAIAARTPYMDICDDADYSQRARGYHERAQAAGVPAITTAGIYPGVSNVMAAHMISIARREYTADWSYATSNSIEPVEPRRVLYSYYTAGSGGVGPTILETSLLLAGEPVVVYANGEKLVVPPLSSPRYVDFGPPIRGVTTYLYNLPEVASTHECMRVPTVSARFATAPVFWNWAMLAVARLAPKGFLEDRAKSKWLATLADPWVRLVDPFIGEAVGMRVDVDLEDGTTASGIFVHKLLSDSVGISTAAFAQAILAGQTQPGVWFPEERGAVSDRRKLLQDAAEGTVRFELNRPPWALESNPIRVGMGMYW
ncbi:saccharopine dehydrogenase-like protein [Coccomyxa subellipsoidea C-169]|uniref:Saccharopine dehydrogenase-like protein n=1 Tax=Coccomyxa subellipsoidea (strain C-169) TaxID=574566 RepID=I0ZAC2_COCSC|nr:saccharopine dehydrogenase-like protein [Coccomyxa subellipsoidea C-169]EIE27591.1 saccharopine dehydrogenase-like protein [Coccomyxa subellipsoidea C-169]|eukprot:XP_005652135.1 saccharopine dehydrogenase-like protein [Coccomyxa subellipsoidea C-169]